MHNDFFISDPHWGHTNIIKYSQRPYSSAKEMDEALIQNWNAVVKPGDTVWNLGDVTFHKPEIFKNIARRLNGEHNVIWGNHDRDLIEKQNEFLNEGLFKSTQYYKELRIKHMPMIVLFHYGMRVWNKSHRDSIMLYGHSHGSLPPFGKSVDVGVDCKEITSEYRPIHLDEVIKYMSKREGQVVDHHGMKDM